MAKWVGRDGKPINRPAPRAGGRSLIDALADDRRNSGVSIDGYGGWVKLRHPRPAAGSFGYAAGKTYTGPVRVVGVQSGGKCFVVEFDKGGRASQIVVTADEVTGYTSEADHGG